MTPTYRVLARERVGGVIREDVRHTTGTDHSDAWTRVCKAWDREKLPSGMASASLAALDIALVVDDQPGEEKK